MGSKVVVCQLMYSDDPKSIILQLKDYQRNLNSWYVNQYDNPSNAKGHYLSTGRNLESNRR